MEQQNHQRSVKLSLLLLWIVIGLIVLQMESLHHFLNLTDDSQHAGGFGGLCITFVFSFIIKHRFVDDEDVLAALSNNFIFLSFSDFTSIFVPADL